MPNRVALVTGGPHGLGLAIARQLAERGFDLAIHGPRGESDEADVLDSLREKNVRVLYCQGDASDRQTHRAMLGQIRDEYGALHVLVNNAQSTAVGRQDLLEADEESYHRLLAVSLKGPFFLTQAVAQWFVEQRSAAENFRGCVINVASVSAAVGPGGRGNDCLARAGTSMATRLWAVRLAEFGVEVYQVQAGMLQSDTAAEANGAHGESTAQRPAPQPRGVQPDDVGRAVAALASGELAYVTGQQIAVDGGMTIATL